MILTGREKHKIIKEERQRITGAIETQKQILLERIAAPETSEAMKTAWTISIIELVQLQSIISYPISERRN
jgi:hypothetical protein